MLRHQHRLPAAPSLPARSRREGMISQTAQDMPDVVVLDDGSLLVDDAALDPEAPLTDDGFSSDAFVGLRAFLTAVADRRGPLKVSVTGPVTFGIALHAAGVERDLAFGVATTAVRQRVTALLSHLADRVPQSQVVVFVDEPAMPIKTTMMNGNTVQAISTATLSWKWAARCPTERRCLMIE